MKADNSPVPVASIRLEDMLGHLLRCASNIAATSFYDTADSADITPRQFSVLLTLRNYGPLTQSQLSSRTRIDSSTINEMTPRMIKRGLITSGRSKIDKRASELRLSDDGAKTLDALIPLASTSQDAVLELLPREYRRIFIHCLQVILETKEEVFLKKGTEIGPPTRPRKRVR
jgi:DNA-binding MarR family transcriptional regulator